MKTWVAGAILFAIVFLLSLVIARFSTRQKPRHPVVAKPVLTAAELAFHARLVRAVARISPRMMIFSQVSMAAILDTQRGLDQQTHFATRSRFNRKIVDFVVTDEKTNVLLVVELDDWSHDDASDKDGARDEITASAGYPTLRIRGAEARDDRMIEARIRQNVGNLN